MASTPTLVCLLLARGDPALLEGRSVALGDSFLVRGRKHACMVAEPHNETSAVRHLVITSPRVTVQELTKDPIHALTDNKLWGAGFGRPVLQHWTYTLHMASKPAPTVFGKQQGGEAPPPPSVPRLAPRSSGTAPTAAPGAPGGRSRGPSLYATCDPAAPPPLGPPGSGCTSCPTWV